MREKEKKRKRFKVKSDEIVFKNEFDCLNNEDDKNKSLIIDNHLY